MICPDPKFEFDSLASHWSECKKCGKLAWDHEQSDPFQDAINWIEVVTGLANPEDRPPAMKKVE